MRRSGFTVLEVAIAVTVVAVLATTLYLGGRFLVGDSRRVVELDLVDRLRNAARQYSQRQKSGLSFQGLYWSQDACPMAPIPLESLLNNCAYRTPWGGSRMAVRAFDGQAGASTQAAEQCRGSACYRICMEVPSCNEVTAIQTVVDSASYFEMTCLTVAGPPNGAGDNCGLGGAGPWLVMTGR